MKNIDWSDEKTSHYEKKAFREGVIAGLFIALLIIVLAGINVFFF